jgi:hypothetical protein
MMRDTATAKNKNRRMRQEALREQLSKQKHLEHVIELVDKIKDENNPVADDMMARYKLAIDTKLRLVNKYLPDLKSTEITGDSDNPLVTSTPVTFVDPE